MSAPPILHKVVAKFCDYHLGKGWSAPLTGTDWRAWRAFVYAVELYAYTRGEAALSAMRGALACAQNREDIHEAFVQVIPQIMDWSDAPRLWAKMVVTGGGPSNWQVRAIQRRQVSPGKFVRSYVGTSPSTPSAPVGGASDNGATR